MMSPGTLHIGSVRTHVLSDGIYWTDGGGAWGVVPRALWERVSPPDAQGRIPMELRCLLIESSAGLVLVDTGYGDKLTPKQREILNLSGERRLLGEIASLGYRPEDVRYVINTHLHADHCGGNTLPAPTTGADVGQGSPRAYAPTFPNATYMMQRLELADAMYPNERTRNTYRSENFLPFAHLAHGDDAQESTPGSSVLNILSGDTQVTPEVRTIVTPGHTRAHRVVIIESRGESAVFLADMVGWAVSLERLAWVPAFDVEPLVSIESKRSLRDWAMRRDALLLFQHDMTMVTGRLTRDGERWRVNPEPLPEPAPFQEAA